MTFWHDLSRTDELAFIARLIQSSKEEIMSAIDDLNAAVAALQANAKAASDTIANELQAIAAAQAASGANDPAIEAAVSNIKAVSDSLAAAAASVQPAPAAAAPDAPAA
jgi:hypothetical protein